ncbi:UDP-glucose 4-epimerase GalE [Streptomyces tirandamycinicus]|uniref:UDP-glucose 4-epimerase n=1 Tax=Streptomyces tirandamycinicus TaxID=2174846 RepID=A0A2S1SQW3_9ACTN|nr:MULTISPECIES: UDP-glucose 4-epimerase GalE [Streptomyces]AWI28789.1 UDP-glucose 4-epimerase GalE [Streptomyces tirandamycinicus]MCY0982198.1 UDP-glucose 4-epimerase GalE [Streptomyces tirandamycinicus]TFE47950.1 UDP-glucose 4-epimerase GalE [Streptomyces sp. ICN441]
MTWLITGGAGFIGSHVVKAMAEGGEHVVVLDDLSTGRAERLPAGVPLEIGTVLDRDTVDRVLRDHAVTGIVHIAGKKQVGESVEKPLHYYRENVEGLRVLLDAAVAAGVSRFLFSSSAAVYGMPDVDLVTEETPCAPINPYGETKLAGEWLVTAVGRVHPVATASLRYFNVAGAATPELADEGVFNLVPMVFERLTSGEAPRIFGDDYPTPDGTCIRDYIHVEDIASAHVAAARRLAADPEARLILNIGRGEGVSVADMVGIIQDVTGHPDVKPEVTDRRPGDPARVVASADRIRAELGWSARHEVREMVESAWAGWRLRHP